MNITDKITTLFGQHCGLNADWSVQAWCVTEGATPNITPQAFYLIDNEDETWKVIRREMDEDDTRVEIASMNEAELLEWLEGIEAERQPILGYNHDEDEKHVTPWQEITEEQYKEALGCLPPEKWQTVNGVNIFRMCEYYTSNITSHYARTGGKFYTCRARTSTSYETLASLIP